MNPIVKFSKMVAEAQTRELASVKDGLLTVDEAAACLAGATLKAREECGNAPIDIPEALRQSMLEDELKYARLWLDTQLPGFDGLVLGRHI